MSQAIRKTFKLRKFSGTQVFSTLLEVSTPSIARNSVYPVRVRMKKGRKTAAFIWLTSSDARRLALVLLNLTMPKEFL